MVRLLPAGYAGPSRTNPLLKPNLAAIFLIVRNILDSTVLERPKGHRNHQVPKPGLLGREKPP